MTVFQWCTRRIIRVIRRRSLAPGTFYMFPFADDKLRMIEVRLGYECPVLITPLHQLTELFPDLGINICGINRNGNMIVPDADDHMEVADEIYFCTLPDHEIGRASCRERVCQYV